MSWTREAGHLDVTSKLGARLRELRVARGLSLQEASDMSGVAQPTLSRIELNKMAPTFGLLCKVVEGLNFPWEDILPNWRGNPSGRSLSVASADSPLLHMGAHDVQLLHPDSPLRKNLAPFIFTTQDQTVEEAGGLVGGPRIEFIYVLDGVLKLHFEGKTTRTLRAGESVMYDGAVPHAFVSGSKMPVRFLGVVAREA